MPTFCNEPNYARACAWWADLPDIWTPIGWKDHLFRFNVLWNGTIYANPFLNRRTEAWEGQGVQLTFIPAPASQLDLARPPLAASRDDHTVRQGWRNGPVPVLWSEWALGGVLLRQTVFAHVPGGQPVEWGDEPLFAWVRLAVVETCDTVRREPDLGFRIKLNAPHFRYTMSMYDHTFPAEKSAYPRILHAETAEGGLRLLEEDGRVRLAVVPAPEVSAWLQPQEEDSRDLFFAVRMPSVAGAHADLLLPMLPCEPALFDEELALGYDGALAEALRYWSVPRPTNTVVDLPEPPLNDLIEHNLRFAEVIAEKNPADGHYSLLIGSLFYADLWPTPMSETAIMFLDALGCHATVEKYLEIFRAEQGTVVPPGEGFILHPGYLSSPKSLTSIDWLSDHGALLYTIAAHALLSGDEAFIARWLDTVVRACEFTQYARGRTDHPGVKGVMPPAIATDDRTPIQGVWSDGWHYKGLTTAVRLLRQCGHPRAAEFAAEAADYRAAFQAAFRARTAAMPTWTDPDGVEQHLTPASLTDYGTFEGRHGFYLDTGPLFLVFAGLLPADDPLMRATTRWFREGPPARLYRHDGNCWQMACLDHEMSSCEPCYSWNIFHAWQLGDRQRFLEGMYSTLAGSVSRKTYTVCETRGGITGLTPVLLPVWLMRLAVVDDQLEEDTLHLLRLVPQAWLCRERETVFAAMPTEYGPVDLRFRRRDDVTLDVIFTPRYRHAPARVVFHRPPGITRLLVNGEVLDAAGERV
jgi:hypothetical protein